MAQPLYGFKVVILSLASSISFFFMVSMKCLTSSGPYQSICCFAKVSILLLNVLTSSVVIVAGCITPTNTFSLSTFMYSHLTSDVMLVHTFSVVSMLKLMIISLTVPLQLPSPDMSISAVTAWLSYGTIVSFLNVPLCV